VLLPRQLLPHREQQSLRGLVLRMGPQQLF
jgi:hypothetical protein